jgi:hypothetical protein
MSVKLKIIVILHAKRTAFFNKWSKEEQADPGGCAV